MTKQSRILLAVASLMLLLLFLFPIWKIALQAPQYPEGLGLEIWINQIRGESPNDLNTINGLNHYIGMKLITPESIPELKIMPWVVGIIILLGLVTAASGKRFLLYAWVILFFAAAVAGLVDFYKWEYDYGHDLNPHAAIKIPGMTYQPPLIGAKQLLNMRTISFPYIGGVIAMMSLLIGMFSMVKEIRQRRKTKDIKNEIRSMDTDLHHSRV
jgi:copper chaperone NosL